MFFILKVFNVYPLQDQIMKFNESRFRKSDIDILTLEKMFSFKGPQQARSTLAYSIGQRSVVSNISKRSIDNSLNMSCKIIKPILNKQVSLKNINQKLQMLSQKLNFAKNQIKVDKSSNLMNININRRHSQLNINIKDRGIVSLKFFPEEKEKNNQQIHRQDKQDKQNKQDQHDKKRDQIKLKMGKSRIEDVTNTEAKPKNIIPLNSDLYKNNRQKEYLIAQIKRARNEKNSLAIEHVNITIQILKEKQQITQQLKKHYHQTIFLQNHPKLRGRKTLILDLDETLIHCLQNAEFQPDIILDLVIADNEVHAQILLRPYVLTFLKKMSKIWEIVIFTASHQQYADGILDEMDPQNEIFHHRLYRQHCTEVNQIYIKDLSRINRDLSKVVIVDNSAYSYILQLQNAVPIFPYYDGNDSELSSLQHYLSILHKCKDVRQINRSYFKLHQYQNYDSCQSLIKQLYLKQI